MRHKRQFMMGQVMLRTKLSSVVVALALLNGCAVVNNRATPPEVAVMPNDCANSKAILNWLDYQIKQEPSWFKSNEEYDREQRILKHKKWSFLHHCNGK